MLTSWLGVAPVAKQDTAAVPLWAYLVPVATVLIAALAGFASAWFTTRVNIGHQDRAFERQVQEEHRQWLRQKKVETYETVLDHFIGYERWRLMHEDPPYEHIDDDLQFLAGLGDDFSGLQRMCGLYLSPGMSSVVAKLMTASTELLNYDVSRIKAGQALLPDASKKFDAAYERVEVALRNDIQSPSGEDPT